MKFVFWLVALFCFYVSTAQQFGGFPPNTKWQQINTDTARIIFTKDATAQAQQIATIVHRMATGTPDPIGTKLRKINIVLQSHTTLANGYVGLGPFRSEYYAIPGGNIFEFGNIPWTEQLAVHEYRHVQQYSNFNNGVSRLFSYVLGEQGQAFANALSVPDWFFEGDAVHTETALTVQGRGRLPYFLNSYHSLWQSGKNYNWMKLRNGSYKDYVPNHYYLGYLLVNYGYAKYGPRFWEKVTHDASAFHPLLYPFQHAIKKYAGIDFKTFRKEAFEYYQSSLPLHKEIQKEKAVVNYYFPQYISDSAMLYLKSSYSKLPRFVIKKGSKEHTIAIKDIGDEDWFDYSHHTIAYTAYSTNPRWSLTNYSDIVLLDTKSGKEKRLTHHQKYVTPVFSPSGGQLLAVNTNDSLQTELHFFDLSDHTLMKTFKAPLNAFFSHPTFLNEEQVITGLRLPDGRMTLALYNSITDSLTFLFPPSANTFGYLQAKKDTLYFTATIEGNDDIYAYLLSSKRLYQLTTGITGHYFPHEYNDTLTWSHFTSYGYEWQQQSVKEMLWRNIAYDELNKPQTAYKVADATFNILQPPTRTFATKPYAKSVGLVHFHSWQPSYTAPEYTVTAYTNNILNTLDGAAYYTYNENEKSHTIGASAYYGGWFPVVKTGMDYTYHRHITTENKKLVLNQYEINAGYYIPLTLTRGKTYKLLSFGSEYVFNQRFPTSPYKDSITKSNTHYVSHYISWRQQLPKAVQHIYPKWGYAVYMNAKNELAKKGFQSLVNGELYLPGLFRNHSLVLSGSYQKTDTGNVVFTNQFVNSRGYGEYYFSKMWRTSINYHLPLVYPDWGFANIFYLLRVRANIFYDHTRYFSKSRLQYKELRSTGTEVFFDTRWWNQLPVTFGVRYSYLLDQKNTGYYPHQWEIVLPVNLIPN